MLSISNLAKFASLIIVLCFVASLAVCKRVESPAFIQRVPTGSTNAQLSGEPIRPIPLTVDLDPAKVELGEKLFNETMLSRNNSISCASCHNLQSGGSDGRVRSIGIDDQIGVINAPTVFNATYNFKQFWDGRAATAEDQIDFPIHADNEMGSNWDEIVQKLRKSPEYAARFAPIYADGVQVVNIKDAIATFERSLITPNSRFDQYLRGDENILSRDEMEGYRIYKSVGCASCHQGMNVGGNLFQEFGVMGNYFKDRGKITDADLGRFNVTHAEEDRYVFKVPGLRNVDRTPPYFHDGSAKTLESAVAVMSKYQLGRELSVQEINLIVKFLRTLNGEYTVYGRK